MTGIGSYRNFSGAGHSFADLFGLHDKVGVLS